MAGKNRNYINHRVILLISIAMSLSLGISFAQNEVNTAPEKLAVLSENLTSDDIAEIRRLLEAGADVNVRTEYGVTPLFMSSGEGHTEIVKLLLGAKADVNTADTDGVTPLFMASRNGYTRIVKLLLLAGTDVNSRVSLRGTEYTPLKLAKLRDHIQIIVDPLYEPAEYSLKTIKDVTEQKIKMETAFHLFTGASYANKGQHDQAISDYTKAVKIDPKFALAYFTRGVVYDNKGQYDQAISDFTKALKINPKFAQAYYARGVVYMNKGQDDQAISDFTKALEINPRFAPAYDNRGLTYIVKLENKVKGCADWKKACELGRCGNYNVAKQRGDCP